MNLEQRIHAQFFYVRFDAGLKRLGVALSASEIGPS